MKRLVAFIIIVLLLGEVHSYATQMPRGELLELHSCQVYIGGCIASSEATQDGRYQLRVWKISDGSFRGVSLGGVEVAILEAGKDNLADQHAFPSSAVAYLADSATPAQNAAVVEWLKQTDPELSKVSIQKRVVPMNLSRSMDNTVTFTAGESIRFRVQPLESCGLTSCGESLWYTPRSRLASYTVGVTTESTVYEPLLQLTWIDHGKNNVFEGRFGYPEGKMIFNSPTMACVAAEQHGHE